MMSGRLSFELVVKAARAGLEILAGVSAPSSLAVEAAEGRGITLCGFVRDSRLTAYAHPGRLKEDGS
jgi:FdhD protein